LKDLFYSIWKMKNPI